jgi:hypothetical protein
VSSGEVDVSGETDGVERKTLRRLLQRAKSDFISAKQFYIYIYIYIYIYVLYGLIRDQLCGPFRGGHFAQ